MKRINLGVLGMILLIIYIFTMPGKVYARSHNVSMGPGPTPQNNHVIRVAPRPPGWPQMWLAADVIKTFKGNGLIVEKIKKDTDIELSDLPAKTKEAIRFSVSFNARILKGYVLEFDEKKNFDKVQKHYLALNNSGKLHTWSLIKDNILLVIDGSMSDQEINKYEAVLAGMK